MENNNYILKIENLTKNYGKKTVIDNISLNIEKGKVYGFLGPNGAGKTTVIKMIVGLISITKGNIYIEGFDTTKEKEKSLENVGAIVENPDLYQNLSGYENLKLFARMRNVNITRIDEVVELVGLKDRIKDKVSKYSLGMKQRLGLAVTLLHKPKLLILDEPTNGLDPAGVKTLRDTLKTLAHKENVTVFVSSHMLSEIELMCDKVAIIDKGKIIKVDSLEKTSDKVESETINYEFYISNNTKAIELLNNIANVKLKNDCLYVEYNDKISNILKILLENDIEIYEFTKKKNTLEDEFLKVTGGNK